MRNLISVHRRASSPARARDVGIDWHGHNDRGLALENALWAFEFGADRVHGTGLGIGERVGNAQMELILLNLKLLGQLEDQDLTQAPRVLPDRRAAPSAGTSRSTTRSSGATRSARRPACTRRRSSRPMAKGDAWLADRIYCGVPAGMFGRKQEICIGFMSGASNVNYWLQAAGSSRARSSSTPILAAAKESDHILTDDEVMAVVEAQRECRATKEDHWRGTPDVTKTGSAVPDQVLVALVVELSTKVRPFPSSIRK